MSVHEPGVIDCDIHPSVPGLKALLPYMDPVWQEAFVLRGIDGLDMQSYPPGAPITCRPDWREAGIKPGTDLGAMQRQSLDPLNTRAAICNVLYGGQVAVSETMGAAICSAINDWLVEHWLDQDSRLRASIVVPAQAPLLAAEEIERRAGDRRFVQVLMPVACEMMLGRSTIGQSGKPPHGTICRSACTPAACIVTHQPRAAGRRIFCTTTWRSLRPSRISC